MIGITYALCSIELLELYKEARISICIRWANKPKKWNMFHCCRCPKKDDWKVDRVTGRSTRKSLVFFSSSLLSQHISPMFAPIYSTAVIHDVILLSRRSISVGWGFYHISMWANHLLKRKFRTFRKRIKSKGSILFLNLYQRICTKTFL